MSFMQFINLWRRAFEHLQGCGAALTALLEDHVVAVCVVYHFREEVAR